MIPDKSNPATPAYTPRLSFTFQTKNWPHPAHFQGPREKYNELLIASVRVQLLGSHTTFAFKFLRTKRKGMDGN